MPLTIQLCVVCRIVQLFDCKTSEVSFNATPQFGLGVKALDVLDVEYIVRAFFLSFFFCCFSVFMHSQLYRVGM